MQEEAQKVQEEAEESAHISGVIRTYPPDPLQYLRGLFLAGAIHMELHYVSAFAKKALAAGSCVKVRQCSADL